MFGKLTVAVLLPAACLAALSPAPDEVRLADGRVLVGSVKRKGDVVEITTRDGVVSVASSEIDVVRTTAQLRTELRKLAAGRKKDAFSEFQLAKIAFSYGLTRDMWRHLDRCLEHCKKKPGSATEGQMKALLTTLEPEILPASKRAAESKLRVRALVQRVRPPAGPAMKAAILELLVAEPGAGTELLRLAKMEPLPEQKLVALAALMRRDAARKEAATKVADSGLVADRGQAADGGQGARRSRGADKGLGNTVHFIHTRALFDKDKAVRAGVAKLIAENGQSAAAVQRFIPGLLDSKPEIRKRTAEAYANLGDKSAVPILVRAGPYAGIPRRGSGGPGVRSHMYKTTTHSFIRDFDVEIAQAAAVANPIIGNARSGVVLDVNVPAVVSQRVQITNAYRRAIKRLAGSDPGRNPSKWAAWLARK